jgi:hypothetical protein
MPQNTSPGELVSSLSACRENASKAAPTVYLNGLPGLGKYAISKILGCHWRLIHNRIVMGLVEAVGVARTMDTRLREKPFVRQ